MVIFGTFFLRNKALLGYKNKTFKKSKNWHFSKRVNRWFWSKNCHLFQPSFLGSLGKKNVFYYNLERENAFLGYKNKKFRKSKNWHFSKPVNPWFWSKNAHFVKLFFLPNIGQENVFYDILERKNAFLGKNIKKCKKAKNWHFSKGVNPWFGSKNANFPNFFCYAT